MRIKGFGRYTQPGPPPPPVVYRAIVAVGESNSGGMGANASLPAPLLAATSRVKILNVTTSVFENMDIGTNNNLDHDGLDPTTHGWEAGFLNYLDNNIQTEPIYYVQTGQGGAQLANFANGGTWWTKIQTRINTAKAKFVELGISPTWEIWITIGINDFLDGAPITPAVYKANMMTLISEVRTMIGQGNVRVSAAEFMQPVKDAYPTYITQFDALATDVANLRIVDTTGLTLQNDYHWDSAGYVALGELMAA